MYLEYWGFRAFPFENVPDPGFFFFSKPHEEGLTRLVYAAEMRKGCALLLGDIGCGKTTLSQVFMQKIPRHRYEIGLISNPVLGPKQFLQDVLFKFQVKDVPEKKVEILRLLNDKLVKNMKENKETLLLVDEAHLLTGSTLEEIRLLLNYQSRSRFLITIFLLGQNELIDKIRTIKQLDQRIAIKYVLRPFDLNETTQYILFREKTAGSKNVFSPEAIEMVYQHSNGLPRMINNLCDLALLVGFGNEKERITPEIISEIVEDGSIL